MYRANIIRPPKPLFFQPSMFSWVIDVASATKALKLVFDGAIIQLDNLDMNGNALAHSAILNVGVVKKYDPLLIVGPLQGFGSSFFKIQFIDNQTFQMIAADGSGNIGTPTKYLSSSFRYNNIGLSNNSTDPSTHWTFELNEQFNLVRLKNNPNSSIYNSDWGARFHDKDGTEVVILENGRVTSTVAGYSVLTFQQGSWDKQCPFGLGMECLVNRWLPMIVITNAYMAAYISVTADKFLPCCANISGSSYTDQNKQQICTDNNYNGYNSNACQTLLNTQCAIDFTIPGCTEYCAQNSINCDNVLHTYCANHQTNQDICGCFQPQTVYDKFYDDYKKAVGPLANGIPNYPNCIFPTCVSSKLRTNAQKSGQDPCPSITSCINNVTVDNNGTMNGTPVISTSNECTSQTTPTPPTSPIPPSSPSTPPSSPSTPPSSPSTPPASPSTSPSFHFSTGMIILVAFLIMIALLILFLIIWFSMK